MSLVDADHATRLRIGDLGKPGFYNLPSKSTGREFF